MHRYIYICIKFGRERKKFKDDCRDKNEHKDWYTKILETYLINYKF